MQSGVISFRSQGRCVQIGEAGDVSVSAGEGCVGVDVMLMQVWDREENGNLSGCWEERPCKYGVMRVQDYLRVQ